MQIKKTKYKNRILARSVSHGVNHFYRNRKKYKNDSISETDAPTLSPALNKFLIIVAAIGLVIGFVELGKYFFVLLLIAFVITLLATLLG